LTRRQAIDAFLAQPALAVVGASRSGKGFGCLALRELRRKGYRVYPVHPHADLIDGARCYHKLAELPEPVGGVVVVVPADQGFSVVREAASLGIHHVWLQQGAESPALLNVCSDLGLETVSGECVLMYAHPSGIHRAHRWLWQALHKIPA
jgi:predicted CoA-binding protein